MVNFRVQSGKFTPGRKIYTDGVSRVTDNYQVCFPYEPSVQNEQPVHQIHVLFGSARDHLSMSGENIPSKRPRYCRDEQQIVKIIGTLSSGKN